MVRIFKGNMRTWTETIAGPHISFKYARYNHLRCPMMGEVSLKVASLNILVHDVINLLYYAFFWLPSVLTLKWKCLKDTAWTNFWKCKWLIGRMTAFVQILFNNMNICKKNLKTVDFEDISAKAQNSTQVHFSAKI